MILTRPEARLVAPRKPRASGDDPSLPSTRMMVVL